MSLQKYFGRLRRIDLLIQKKSTGNIDCFAKKISLFRAGAYKFLEEMKNEGFPIAYNKKEKTYYYTRAGKMTDNLFKEAPETNDVKKVVKEKNFKIFSKSTYSRLSEGNFA